MYVTANVGEYLFKISTNNFKITGAVLSDPSVPSNGNGTGNFRTYQMILSPNNNQLYVTCQGPKGNQSPDLVKVFNTSDLSLARNINVEDNPLLLKYTPDNKFILSVTKIQFL